MQGRLIDKSKMMRFTFFQLKQNFMALVIFGKQ